MTDDDLERVRVRQIKRDYALTDEIVIDDSKPTVRTVFRGAVHPEGIRGEIIRQKIGTGGVWADVNEVNFRLAPPDAGVKIAIPTKGLRELMNHLQALARVHSEHGTTSGQWVVAPESRVAVADSRAQAAAMQELIDAGHSPAFWDLLIENNPELATRLAVARVHEDRAAAVEEFRAGITAHADDEDYWQEFFKRSVWILEMAFTAPVVFLSGETYLGGKRAMGRQGKGGVATDFLFQDESTKSFAAVEIKTPDAHLVGAAYRNKRKEPLDPDDRGFDNEVFQIHGELSGGLVQLRNQITVAIESFDTTLGREYAAMTRVHPRGVLLAGTYASLGPREAASFNHFRHGLYATTVITFDELLARLDLLVPLSQPV